eukprot:1222100-Alexandrium_andersonii.AAC.1
MLTAHWLEAGLTARRARFCSGRPGAAGGADPRHSERTTDTHMHARTMVQQVGLTTTLLNLSCCTRSKLRCCALC